MSENSTKSYCTGHQAMLFQKKNILQQSFGTLVSTSVLRERIKPQRHRGPLKSQREEMKHLINQIHLFRPKKQAAQPAKKNNIKRDDSRNRKKE